MADPPPAVAITGSSGYIGSRLLQELESDETLQKSVAIDNRPLPMPYHNVAAKRLDVTQPLDDTFREQRVNTVVHLAYILKPGRNKRDVQRIRQTNLKAVRNVLKASKTNKVRNLIYLSSHTVYGANKDNPVPLTEEAPVRPSTKFQYSYDKSLCEQEVQQFAKENTNVNVTVLRSCVVMGPGADNFVTRAFFKPLLLGVMGYNPPLQFLHEDDLAKLLHQLIIEPCPGTFNVAGEGVIHYKRMAQLSRRKLIFLPAVMAYFAANMTWNLGIQEDSPAAGLDFVRYPLIVSTGKLKKETGFQFFYTSEDALMSYLPDRIR